jgi:hypothetical protein
VRTCLGFRQRAMMQSCQKHRLPSLLRGMGFACHAPPRANVCRLRRLTGLCQLSRLQKVPTCNSTVLIASKKSESASPQFYESDWSKLAWIIVCNDSPSASDGPSGEVRIGIGSTTHRVGACAMSVVSTSPARTVHKTSPTVSPLVRPNAESIARRLTLASSSNTRG